MIRKLFLNIFIAVLVGMSFGAKAQTSVKKSFASSTEKGDSKAGKIYDKRYLYVATPGIRNYLGYGGHGILVFDMDNNHRFVKRIKTGGMLSDSLMGRMRKGGFTSAKGDEVPSNVLWKVHSLFTDLMDVVFTKDPLPGVIRGGEAGDRFRLAYSD